MPVMPSPKRDHQAADDLFAMADRIADAQAVLALAVKQDGEQIVGNHVLDDGGDVRQNAVEVERLGGVRRHFEQEIEQLGALLKTNFDLLRAICRWARPWSVPDSAVRSDAIARPRRS